MTKNLYACLANKVGHAEVFLRLSMRPPQDFDPHVAVFDIIVPAGALVADALRLPKVGLAVVPPFSPKLNVPSENPVATSLMPMVPYWKPTPMVSVFQVKFKGTHKQRIFDTRAALLLT